MNTVAAALRAWMRAGRPFALASLIGTTGSSPRPLGTALAVDAEGRALGGVSGGCVEAAVYLKCQEVLASGTPAVESFGYSDEDAVAVGLTCGGTMDVLVVRVEPDDAAITAALDAVIDGEPVTLVRAAAGPHLGQAVALTAHGFSGPLELGATDLPAASGRTGDYAVEVHTPPPRLLVYGAIDFAGPLVRIAKQLGYRVTVCDARPVFATEIRFPEADEVVVDWPHRHFAAAAVDADTAVCVLTHDEKFDTPLFERALPSDAGFIGAMGSRATHRARLARLRDAGVPEAALARLRSPIGLDLNGRTAEETALSILAEITAVRNGAAAGFLTEARGPIHR
ncbi:xanthine dehydrogenase accessory factor [Glycomyces sambucus]|uniref:Xanthine dehydrogenase accessory factor n=1 Tax=Glycomyces sambucus TaxID=380244 RepID=A0A1G9LH32_9ACTN|nr:XdhC family protein [Glycomyces sambucus]SDL61073.1 xanthine dehydrogenase accessory factor [Glycomyces sambucus]